MFFAPPALIVAASSLPPFASVATLTRFAFAVRTAPAAHPAGSSLIAGRRGVSGAGPLSLSSFRVVVLGMGARGFGGELEAPGFGQAEA